MTTTQKSIPLIDACFAFTGPREGNVLWMYRDDAAAGYATVGRGHRLYSALYAANIFGVDLSTMQPQWDALMALPGGKDAAFYEQATTLRLEPAKSDELFRSDLDSHLLNCRDYVPGFMGLPQPIQTACIDIDFNVKGGIRTFPAMISAIQRRDWQKVAAESYRPQLPNRSIATRNLILSVAES